MTASSEASAHRLRDCLEGLAVGDAFGERFFINPDVVENLIIARALPSPPWRFTDDTLMALSIAEVLSQYGHIEQDALAKSFAEHYDSSRGYGPSMHGLLGRIRNGEPWIEVSQSQFAGQGSYGNGSAMRVAPIGAFFVESLDDVVEQAERSSVVTHVHTEAIAGALAVAVAAAHAFRLRGSSNIPDCPAFLDLVLPFVPTSEVRSGIRKARDMGGYASVQFAASVLGSGTRVSAQDTVPFALWCAAQCLADFEEAMWLTVSGLGDRDTTCAIVGGIVGAHVGVKEIPGDWLQAREALPAWALVETPRRSEDHRQD